MGFPISSEVLILKIILFNPTHRIYPLAIAVRDFRLSARERPKRQGSEVRDQNERKRVQEVLDAT